jgi:signal transduction histidine kinase
MTHAKSVIGLILLLTLIGSPALSQDTYSGKNISVEQCLSLAEKNKQAGDIKEATRYINTAAMQVWEDKNYADAITYFNQSIELNQTINNASGIAKINSNLGMIYSDLAQFEKSLAYFQRSLDYRLKHGDKSEIISTYINKGVVLNNLKKHEAAAADIEEALRLATEMNDAAQMKSCYGMLAETYEKAGNQERTMHYFNLYRTFHEMIQRNKVNEAKKETEAAQMQMLQTELEKKKQEIALLNSNRELALSEEELKKLDQEVRTLLDSNTKKELAISLLKREIELDELRISDVESKNNIQKTWTIISIIGFVGVLLIALLLYRNYTFKKKVNHQLSEQNEEIKTLNENLEVQVAKRTLELQKTLIDLEKRNRDLDQFSHVISHNLRGPVASILGLGRIINRENHSDPLNYEIFNRLISAAQNLDSVVSDLSIILDVKGNLELPKEKIELSQLVIQSEKLLVTDIQKSGLQISLLGEVTSVEGVKVYLESILYNLISNTIKYASADRPPVMKITATNHTNGKIKHQLISFTDNGIGISANDYDKIFQPYKRLSAKGSGKGLGLYLVKTQVEAMGGKVSVSSQEGEGTTFTIQLPNN